MIKPGNKAPEVGLESGEGRRISLADLAGRWVVLFFYVKDSTSG